MKNQGFYYSILIVLSLAPKAFSQNWKNPIGQRCPRGQVFHRKSERCYSVGTKCPGLMKFYDIGGGYGACRCVESFGGSKSLVFWPPHNRCYPIDTKGPCPDFQVLIQDWENPNLGQCSVPFTGAHGPGDLKDSSRNAKCYDPLDLGPPTLNIIPPTTLCREGYIYSRGKCCRIVRIR